MAPKIRKAKSLIRRLQHKPKSKIYHSIDSKLKIITYSESHGKHSAAKKFKVDRNQIRKWEKQKLIWESMPIENRISLKFINSKQGAIDSLFKQLYDHVKESLNEMIPITTFSLIQKMLELDPSKSKIQYKGLQSIILKYYISKKS